MSKRNRPEEKARRRAIRNAQHGDGGEVQISITKELYQRGFEEGWSGGELLATAGAQAMIDANHYTREDLASGAFDPFSAKVDIPPSDDPGCREDLRNGYTARPRVEALNFH